MAFDLKAINRNSPSTSISGDEPDIEAALEELEILSEEIDEYDEDNEIFSDHGFQTKPENSDSIQEELPIRNSWYGRDNFKWSKTPAIRGRTPAHNLVTILPRLAGPAGNKEKDLLFRATMSLAKKKLAAVSELFDKFVARSKSCYSMGIYLTVYERLVPFRGRCGFRMHIPNKPAKYGIKIQCLAEAKTHYLVNAEIYAGKCVADAPKSILSNLTKVPPETSQETSGTVLWNLSMNSRNMTCLTWGL
ncbi:uncharacterized protein [Diabrotica undecimpunctata]|uniref:uncharacterized protein n=1 Tax=Diabrotica undecimpunctata TaxID=50387 RepID=UPI003B636791